MMIFKSENAHHFSCSIDTYIVLSGGLWSFKLGGTKLAWFYQGFMCFKEIPAFRELTYIAHSSFNSSNLSFKGQFYKSKNTYQKYIFINCIVGNFKFPGSSFSKVMPNFCRHRAMWIHKIQSFANFLEAHAFYR